MKLETFSYEPDKGWSTHPFPALDSERTLLVVFGAARYLDDPAPLRELRAVYPAAHWIGCSTSGEIHGTLLADDTLTVAVARFDSSALSSAFVPIDGAEQSFESGQELGRMLVRPDLRSIFVVSDGLNVNGSQLVRGLNAVVPSSIVITGGLAGDGDRFQRTWVLDGATPRSHGISAVGLYGDHLRVGHGSEGGWDRFGPARRITRAHDNVLYELDGRPALSLYKEYLGERAKDLPASALLFPLALTAEPGDSKILVRTVLAVNEDDQSMTFAGDVPEGSLAQLMRANFERLIEGACSAARQTRGSAGEVTGGSDLLSIAISCVGRRLILGERAEEEIEVALNELPAGARQIGFYSYGEISPFSSGGCGLHNQTMALTTITEA